MRRHRRPADPTTPAASPTSRATGFGSLALLAVGVVAFAGFAVHRDGPGDRTGGPRFRNTELPTPALGPVALP